VLPVRRLPCLDLYDAADPFRLPTFRELVHPLNLLEWLGVSTAGFPEPFTFALRAYGFLRTRLHRYDIVHDNQCLGYGLYAVSRHLPTTATIHHPISIDRALAVKSARFGRHKFKQLRWHSFIAMQKRVARALPHLITVSESSATAIMRSFGITDGRISVVPNGIDTGVFHPLPHVPRERNRLIVTSSAGVALKGLDHLLLAVARLRQQRPVRLVVVGAAGDSRQARARVADLGLAEAVTFTGRISDAALVRQYARVSLAVVPSLYEGFGLPAGEAMACGVPVISTTGGALPEVVAEAGVLVPPADPDALAGAINELLEDPRRAFRLGRAGHRRVQQHYTWRRTAIRTVAVYRKVIDAHRRI
jgi:glycosyltransferase involved in cell wall biosynthesis